MEKIGIFFGTDTGNTERVANLLKDQLKSYVTEVNNISKSERKKIEKYKNLIFGIPTWYYGEPQCDWEDFFPILKKINFRKKSVAIFGCGDQEDYEEYFCDAMGILKKIIEPLGAKIVGKWSTSGYFFKESKGLINQDYFVGLAIDEDRQPELSKIRVKSWTEQIIQEMNLK